MKESEPHREPRQPGPHFVGRPRNPGREFWLWVLSALVLAILLRLFVFVVVKVNGISMEPNLSAEQRLVVDKLTLHLRLPRPGEIVVVPDPEDPARNLIKRVVGLPGQQVAIVHGMLNINGRPVAEPYLLDNMDRDMAAVTVPPQSIFLMGDNRNNSLDSRSFGPVDLSRVEGRVIFRLWPMSWIKRPGTWAQQVPQ